ncbi:MAG: Hsp20/alpha crystallin family protein [Candidatus Hydrothermarchaeota archaeon]
MSWDPWEEFREIEKRMNRLFRDLWGLRRGWRPSLPARERAIEPREEGLIQPFTDIIETDKEIVVSAEIPGVAKEDININVTEDSIEISAETKREEKEEREGYIRRERSYGKYYRSYSLPSSVNPDEAKATYKNGVLEIRLPKTEVKKGKTIKIE